VESQLRHQRCRRSQHANRPPIVGELKSGRAEFCDQEPYNGRAILVRFRIGPTSPDSAESEQAFSSDGGKTWEVNWINKYTRLKSD
jgi:hypothetical protein